MSTAVYRFIRNAAISDTPLTDDYREYVPGDFIELPIADAIQLMEFGFLVFDEDETRRRRAAAHPVAALA